MNRSTITSQERSDREGSRRMQRRNAAVRTVGNGTTTTVAITTELPTGVDTRPGR